MPKDDFENIPIKELNNLTLAQVREKLTQADRAIKALLDIFPDLKQYRLTKEERPRAASQAFTKPGEKEALFSILDAAELSPGSVQHLKTQDHGNDPELFEPNPARARITLSEELRTFAEKFEQGRSDLNDVAIRVGLLGKPFVRKVYKVLKPVADTMENVRAVLSTAIDFFKTKRKDDEDENI
jgi:hypothetical protein